MASPRFIVTVTHRTPIDPVRGSYTGSLYLFAKLLIQLLLLAVSACASVVYKRRHPYTFDFENEFFEFHVITQREEVPEDIPRHQPLLITNSYPGTSSDSPSHPIPIYRTDDEFSVPEGPQTRCMQARPVFDHPIQLVWPKLGEQVYRFLDSHHVLWTTIDPVRFAERDGKVGQTLYLWVGVEPRSLSLEVAKTAAVGCKKILAAAEFSDIEIAFRESVFTRSAGPQLLNHVSSEDPTADIRMPFTGALGVRIAPLKTPYLEGTGTLYLSEGGQSNRVFLLTARHVALPPREHLNTLYDYDPSEPHEVVILGNKAYRDALEEMMAKIRRENMFVDMCNRKLNRLGPPDQDEDATVASTRREFTAELVNRNNTITAVGAFHGDIPTEWRDVGERVLGHVVYAPPLSVAPGPKPFTEDWALIELEPDKIDWNNFKGNVVYLGSTISVEDFIRKMDPHRKGNSFEYPDDGLLQVKGIIKEKELRHPTSLDADHEPCLFVIKNGMRTGVTIGRATGIESFVREYDHYGKMSTSMEIAIHSYDHKSGAFSDPGDSGSIVVDGLGRILGILTGGAGLTDTTDVTYVTPYFWIEERIKEVFPDSFLYPIMD